MTTIPILAGTEAERWIRAHGEIRTDPEARTAVEPILRDVERRGDAAVRAYSRQFDGLDPGPLEVSPAARQRALADLPDQRREALERARANIERFHRSQRREEPTIEVSPGLRLWREFRPLERIGIYVPGGRADYPSSVLMCGVPARLAGCGSIVVCSPGRPDGGTADSVTAAAELLELDAIYAIGGAQAIAAMAYGTETVPRVDKIFGPGNRYVTAAKEMVYGLVDIDMPAGPSEIVVLCDHTAAPRWVAADLISQAEHAPDARAIAITPDRELARRVASELEAQLERLPDPGVARQSLSGSGLCVAPNLETAIAWANRLAPEHLEIVTEDDDAVLQRIRNAGSVFIGPYSPVAAGDYATGGNHVLPTSTRARAWSALSLDDFGRWMLVQRADRAGLESIAETTTTLARWEGLEAHARAVEIRFEEP